MVAPGALELIAFCSAAASEVASLHVTLTRIGLPAAPVNVVQSLQRNRREDRPRAPPSLA